MKILPESAQLLLVNRHIETFERTKNKSKKICSNKFSFFFTMSTKLSILVNGDSFLILE